MALDRATNLETLHSKSQRSLGRHQAGRDETLASWERKSGQGSRRTVDGKTQTISFGATRYECRKLEMLVQSEELETAEEGSQPSGKVLENRVRRLLQKLRKVAEKETDGIQVIMGLLSTIVMLESGDRFESAKNAINEFINELSKTSGSLGDRSSEADAKESYIKRQTRLFHQSFDELYKKYPNQYVLFHEGTVLFAADSLSEVAKVAYTKRKVKDIFIERVVSFRDTIEVITPIVVENTELA